MSRASPVLALHRGNFRRDHVQALVVDRYKQLFARKPRRPELDALIEEEVAAFLGANPLSATRLKELEKQLRAKFVDIPRARTLQELPKPPASAAKVRKSYNGRPRRASLAAPQLETEASPPPAKKSRRAQLS